MASQGSSRSLLAKLSGFTFLPLIGLVLPIVLLPAMARTVGAAGWTSVLAGMTIGTFASSVIQWGWNVDGTVWVAQTTDKGERASLYGRSLRCRLVLSLVVVPVACVIAALVASNGFRSAGAAGCVATSVAALSPAFYAIGAGDPVMLARYDTLPKALGTLLAVPLVMWTGAIWPYPVCVLVALIVSLFVFGRRHAPQEHWWPTAWVDLWSDIVAQRHTAGYSVLGAAYAAMPLPIASALIASAAVTAPLSSTDQFYRYGLFGVVALGNAVQGWTLDPAATNCYQRQRAAMVAHVALGVLGLAALVFAGPWVGTLLFGAPLAPTVPLCVAYGVAYLALSMATPLSRNLLIPGGRQAFVLRCTAISAIVGVAIMVVSAASGSVLGVAWGMAASEVVSLGLQWLPARRLWKEQRHD